MTKATNLLHSRIANDSGDMEELCRLLTTLSQSEIQDLKERLENPAIRAKEVSHVVADAVRISANRDDKLGTALSPMVEGAIHSSIKNNPVKITEILAPVMGPAIRTSIHNALQDYTTSVDRMLQNSLSLKALGWRVEAMRTGKSFGELVLFHTLEYRVEHVFLINRADGLLISQVSHVGKETDAPDAVSGMLTAIDDFVNDSFRVDSGSGLGKMQIGDLTVLICKGQKVFLATVVRGQIPRGFSSKISSTLDSFELEFSDELKEADLDVSSFASYEPRLRELLQIKLKHSESEDGDSKKKSLMLPLIGLALLAGLLYWLFGYLQERSLYSSFFDDIDRQPGLVITEIDKSGGKYNVKGLRDPLAPSPEAHFSKMDFYEEGKINFDFRNFYSLEESIVLKRLKSKLDIPKEVGVGIRDGGVLVLTGSASEKEITSLLREASGILGVTSIDAENLKPKIVKVKPKVLPPSAESLLRNETFLTPLAGPDKNLEFFKAGDSSIERLVSLVVRLRDESKNSGLTKIVTINQYWPSLKAELEYEKNTRESFKVALFKELNQRGVDNGMLQLSEASDKVEACNRFPENCESKKAFVYFSISQSNRSE